MTILHIYHWVWKWKKFKNWLISDDVTCEIIVEFFLSGHTVFLCFYHFVGYLLVFIYLWCPDNIACSMYTLPSVLWRCWLGGRKGIRPVERQSGGVLVWLSVWSEVQTCIWPSWCHCHLLSLALVKSRLVLPFWYWLACVVPEKEPLNVCVCVCVCTLLLLFLLANKLID